MEDSLKFNNGKEIKFQDFNQKIKKNDLTDERLKQLFNIFDTDNSGVLETKNKNGINEVQQLWNLYKSAASKNKNGDNSVLDDVELKSFTQNLKISKQNINSTDVANFLKLIFTEDKSSDAIKLTDEQAKEEIIKSLSEDLSSSYQIYQSQNNGIVTKGYDYLKKIFDSDLASSNVEEALALQSVGTENLELARKGKLSKREYYLQNKEHLKTMLIRRLFRKNENTGFDFLDRNRGTQSKAQFAKLIEDYIQSMLDNIQDIDSLKKIQYQLINLSEKDMDIKLKSLVKNAKNKKLQNPQESNKSLSNAKIKGNGIPLAFDSSTPITFEEVFRYERGCTYSKQNVETYLNTHNELTRAMGSYNKYQQYKNSVNKFLKDYTTAITPSTTLDGKVIGGNEPNPELRASKFIELYQTYYNNPINKNTANDRLQEIIQKSKLPVQIKADANGNITLDLSAFKNDVEKNRALNLLMRLGLQEQEIQAKKVFGGNPEEKILALSQDNKSAHDVAFGDEYTADLVKLMEEDNNTSIQRYTGNAQTVGMGLTVIGTVLCWTPLAPAGGLMVTAGNIMAVGGIATQSALGYTEALTRNNFNSDEISDLTKSLVMNAGGFVIGFKAGKTGMKAFNKLIDKKLAQTVNTAINDGNRAEVLKEVFTNPTHLKNFITAAGIKLSTDFLISYAGDLAMMGILDTNDDWKSLLKANLIGVIVGSSSEISAKGRSIYKSKKIIESAEKLTGGQTVDSTKFYDFKNIDELVPEIGKTHLETKCSDLIKGTGKETRLTQEAEKLVNQASVDINKNAEASRKGIKKDFIDYGFGDIGEMHSRSKSLQSTHDKIKSYIIDNPDKTLEDAIRAVYDANGLRTVNLSKVGLADKEVQKLLKSGDTKSAYARIAELQSEYVLKAFENVIDDMATGNPKISIYSISNYVGEDGIPYFSERQLNELRNYAIKRHVNIPIKNVVCAAQDREYISKPYAKKSTTKVRASGYSALQANFVTKDGNIFEFQFRGEEVNKFGEGEHVPYDLRQGKDIIGKNKQLKILYNPIKNLLSKKNMPQERYDEYNAYLTAHYKYCRLVEMGIEKPGNPPKLPEGFDERLRAENLIILHDISERLKDNEITPTQAILEYKRRIIRNNANNVTNESYLKNLQNYRKNPTITEYEAQVRLTPNDVNGKQTNIINTCKDKNGNIRANLVKMFEYMRDKGIGDNTIMDFINKNKSEDGIIDLMVYKKFCENIAKK